MRITQKLSVVAVSMAACTLLVSGCANGGPESDTAGSSEPSPNTSNAETDDGNDAVRADADLVIWWSNSQADAVKPLAEEFGKENGITVAVQTISGDIQSNFITADLAGKGPDIVMRSDSNVAPLVVNGVVDPIGLTEDQLAGFADTAIEGASYKGRVWGLPYAIESVFLLRNKALVPDAPDTFEDLVETGQKAIDDGNADRVLNIPVGESGDFYHGQAFYASAGGYIFGTNRDGDSDIEDVGVGKEGSKVWADKLAEYGDKGKGIFSRSVTADNAISLFAEGKTAYLITGPWALADVQKAGIDYGISNIPGFSGMEEARPFTATQQFFIASHGENKALAQEFVLNTLATVDAQVAISERGSQPPALTDARAIAQKDDADIAAIGKAAVRGVNRPKIAAIKEVWAALDAAEAAIVGGAEPEETIASAGATIRRKIG